VVVAKKLIHYEKKMNSQHSRRNRTLLLILATVFFGVTLHSGDIIAALMKSKLVFFDFDQLSDDVEKKNRKTIINQQLEELTANLQDKENRLSESSDKISILEDTMRSLQTEESKLKASIEKLKFELVDQQNKKKFYESNKAKVASEVGIFKTENQKLKNKIEDLNRVALEKTRLENSFEILKEKNKSLIEQIEGIPDKEKLLKRSKELEDKIVKLNDQLTTQKNLIEGYESNRKIQLNKGENTASSGNDDYKNLILNLKKQHRNEIEKLKNEISRTEKYKVNFDELNGIKVVFSGFMGYDLNRKEIIFMTREGQKIMMVQDNFTGTLVGECGLPVISNENETRCAATIIARLLFHKSGPIMKGLEIVEVRKK
jgi:hypothetical protein